MAATTVALLMVLGTVVGGASPAAAYTPDGGALFNDPSGDPVARNRSMAHIRRSIQSAPPHSVIRIATYSHDRRDITDALVAACRERHVTVQMVLNDNWTSRQTRRLRRLLGTNIDPHWGDTCNPVKKPDASDPDPSDPDPSDPDPSDPDASDPDAATRLPYPEPSFVKICYQSCRLGAGNQHMKIFMFSDTGASRNVIMLGSTNTAGFAARVHWNDLFTVRGKPAMFRDYSKIFRQLAEDRWRRRTYWKVRHGDLVTEFGAKRNARGSRDPVAQRLAKVGCRAGPGTGVRGRTSIRIMMYAWVGRRGLYLARRVADLSRRGCNVRAILSGASRNVKTVLRRGGVRIRSADLDLDGDPETGFGETRWDRFTHEKWMALNGTWAGEPARIVWTGSENWANMSYRNDEVTLMIPRRGAQAAYAEHFGYLWRSHTRPF